MPRMVAEWPASLVGYAVGSRSITLGDIHTHKHMLFITLGDRPWTSKSINWPSQGACAHMRQSPHEPDHLHVPQADQPDASRLTLRAHDPMWLCHFVVCSVIFDKASAIFGFDQSFCYIVATLLIHFSEISHSSLLQCSSIFHWATLLSHFRWHLVKEWGGMEWLRSRFLEWNNSILCLVGRTESFHFLFGSKV
jgi:hypothetical protein